MTEWIHLVKMRCVNCDDPIKNPVKNYEERGNWCVTCNAKADKYAKKHLTYTPED